MNLYYSFISGLPDLEFNPETAFTSPNKFELSLGEILDAEEITLLHLLRYPEFHYSICMYLSGHTHENELLPGFKGEAFQSSNEHFEALPAYLQHLVVWKENRRGEISNVMVTHKIQQYYFAALHATGNYFLNEWADMELNRLNFLAAHRIDKLGEENKQQLIKGNEYHDLLLEYPLNQKIIRTEFRDAERLEQLLAKPNYLEREQDFDRLRWNAIDEINRFEYFTINIILGYYQKLLILDRWKKVFAPENPVDPVVIAEKMMQEKQR